VILGLAPDVRALDRESWASIRSTGGLARNTPRGLDQLRSIIINASDKCVRKRLSDTLRPLQAKCIAEVVRLTATETPDQRNHQLVGTGSAVSPIIRCLSAQGYRQDRSDDHATLDGLKLSRLSSGFV
jgi:hypothetical protein